jgi:hypothetical protein
MIDERKITQTLQNLTYKNMSVGLKIVPSKDRWRHRNKQKERLLFQIN